MGTAQLAWAQRMVLGRLLKQSHGGCAAGWGSHPDCRSSHSLLVVGPIVLLVSTGLSNLLEGFMLSACCVCAVRTSLVLQAFLLRKLKLSGSMGLAMKLQPILDAAAPRAKL